jgi:pimeloyl-ACP methyl ester carboxylesterase
MTLPDPYSTFLASTFEDRLTMLGDSSVAAALSNIIGADAVADYRELADRLRQQSGQHLSDAPQGHVVFIPGVMGSMLASHGLGGIWWLDVRARHHINDLRLDADGLTDADPRSGIGPVAIDMTYEPFFANIFEDGRYHCSGFPYDWRKKLDASADLLAQYVAGASAQAPNGEVHLVAHSMGGLVVRVALMRNPKLWNHIGKIVFLGTPHYGSPAIAGYLKNHLWGFNTLALLGKYLDRDTYRSLWGVLSLMPAPAGIYPGTRPGQDGTYPCADFDLYSAAAWHLGLNDSAERRLQMVLDHVASLHRQLYGWHSALDQDYRDRMLAIVGVGYKTLFRLAYGQAPGCPWKQMHKVASRQAGNPNRDGDGRVPVASASLEWLGETRFAHVEHGRLASVPAVLSDVLSFLSDSPLSLPRSPEGALGRHLGAGPEDSIMPGLSLVPRLSDEQDPGYLRFDDIAETELAMLDRALDEGQLPEFQRVRLL